MPLICCIFNSLSICNFSPNFKIKYLIEIYCKRLIIYIFAFGVSMSVAEIIIDPIVILHMTGYFQKNSSYSIGGATFGFIYAKQVQLKFLIALTAPLGTDRDSVQQLLSRAENFQKMRKTKSKTTHSYYLEYELLGFYVMRRKCQKSQQKLVQLSAAYSKKGSPYTLSAVVDEGVSITFKKDNVLYPYIYEMQTHQKICIDSYNSQNSKSLVKLTINKESAMIANYNENVTELLARAQNKTLTQTQLIELTEILDNYDRIKKVNQENKLKTLEALNYSVLVGLSVARTLGI